MTDLISWEAWSLVLQNVLSAYVLCRDHSVKTRKRQYCVFYTCVGRAVAQLIEAPSYIQTGRPRVRLPTISLEFFTDLILPAQLWPWGRLSL